MSHLRAMLGDEDEIRWRRRGVQGLVGGVRASLRMNCGDRLSGKHGVEQCLSGAHHSEGAVQYVEHIQLTALATIQLLTFPLA